MGTPGLRTPRCMRAHSLRHRIRCRVRHTLIRHCKPARWPKEGMLSLFFDICGQFSEEEAKTLQAGLGRHFGQFAVTTWREAGSQRGWHRCCCRCATGDSGEDGRNRRAMRGKCIPVVRAATVRVGSCPLPRTSQASGAEPPLHQAVSADDSSPLKCGATARAEYEATGYYRGQKKKKKNNRNKTPVETSVRASVPTVWRVGSTTWAVVLTQDGPARLYSLFSHDVEVL